MFDMIKKSILAGIGAVVITEEKLQDIIDDFVQKGKLSQQEGESLVVELQKILREQREKLTATIDERITCVMKELRLLTRDDQEETRRAMQTDLRALELRVSSLEHQQSTQEDADSL